MKAQNYKIGFYIRVSTEEQAENPEGSIRNQEDRLNQTLRLKNMEGNFGEIAGVYIDRAKSGKDTNRPELQKLLQAIRTEKVNLVMVSELSRISRNMLDFSEIWEMMKRRGCGFYSLRENFDTTTAAGEMVLYTLANLAQFERRQVSERVAANVNARSARGLYNGGSIPVGYRRMPDKPGFLATDEAGASLVQTVFDTFLLHGTLSSTAKALNKLGYRLPKKVEAGGKNMRLDFFTVDNVHHMLRNKMYIGVKEYKSQGVVKDAVAVWEALIDRELFDQVQEKLTVNCSAKKPLDVKGRYPYLLTGLVKCATCGDAMVGKSAHGRHEKIGYYEHSWATKRNSTLTEKIFRCEPQRILAKKLEPFVIEKTRELLMSDELAKELIRIANEAFEQGSPKKEMDRLKAGVYGYNSQLEALAERLGELPKNVNPRPIFTQMEKIEGLKRAAEERIYEIEASDAVLERPAALGDYKEFLKYLRGIFESTPSSEIKSEIIKRIFSRIDIGPASVTLHYVLGEPQRLMLEETKGLAVEDNESAEDAVRRGRRASARRLGFLYGRVCSNSLTSGAPGRT